MNLWRAENWKNPYYLEDSEGGFYNQYPEFAVYEAGADAMLEALKQKRNIFVNCKNPKAKTFLWNINGENGWVIHIPDEES